jgi:nucleoside-diphosphate-sugar epimerase
MTESRQVLVTGAGGYIGSVLTRLLLEHGYAVKAVDRFFFGRDTLPPDDDRLTTVEADIRELDEGAFEGVYGVIDLAALSNDPVGELDPEVTWSVNHRGRARVARLAGRSGVARYILPSSCSVYGFQDEMLDETSAINPLTTYAKANRKAEEDILPLANGDFCVTVIRQATVYGASHRMRFDLAINGMVKGFRENGKIPILRDGTQWRPFVHVRDTSRAMLRLLEASPASISGEIFNVGSDDQNVQIMPLAELVAESVGRPFDYEWYGSPDHRSYRVSFAKIRDRIDFRCEWSPAHGAAEVHEAIEAGQVDPEDPRTITVGWYKRLLSDGVEI